ncbi:MAG: hypothetical protein QE274_07635, partial [Verrucomicrobiaceae bacterium]|nr:hypothetical protein [Verrucomicrobiaceae bacterium]
DQGNRSEAEIAEGKQPAKGSPKGSEAQQSCKNVPPANSAICNLQSAIRNPQSAIRNPQSAIRNPQSAIRNPHP